MTKRKKMWLKWSFFHLITQNMIQYLPKILAYNNLFPIYPLKLF